MTGRPDHIDANQREVLHRRLDHDLTNHAPEGPHIVEAMEAVRELTKHAGHGLIEFCPVGRELSLALTALEQATMYAIAAIARQQDVVPSGAGE
jgi:hypothetical protein